MLYGLVCFPTLHDHSKHFECSGHDLLQNWRLHKIILTLQPIKLKRYTYCIYSIYKNVPLFFHTWTNLCKNRGVYSTSLLTVSVLVLSTFIFISRHLLHLFSVQYPIIVFSTNVIAENCTQHGEDWLQSDKIFTRIDLTHLKGPGATWTQFTHQSLNTHSEPVSGADVPCQPSCVKLRLHLSHRRAPWTAHSPLNKVRRSAGHIGTWAGKLLGFGGQRDVWTGNMILLGV